MNIPFRRFIAALGLACPSVVMAQFDIPQISPLPVEVIKQVQGVAPFLEPLPISVAPSKTPVAPTAIKSQIAQTPSAEPAPAPVAPPASAVAAATTETAPDVAPLVADRLWVGIDFFVGQRSGAQVPQLLTTSTQPFTTILRGGLGRPGTSTVFGGNQYLNSFAPGMRFNAGFFLDDSRTWSIDGNLFSLYNQFTDFTATRTGAPGLFVPVNRVSPTPGFTGPVGFPFFLFTLSNATAHVENQFIGADTNVRYGLVSNDTTRVDALVGYRYAHLNDTVTLDTNGANAALGIPIVPFNITTSDTFRTLNNFHGVNLGLSGVHRIGSRFTVQGRATVALGQTFSTTQISGSNTFAPSGPFAAFTTLFRPLPPNTGLLTNVGNSGEFHSNRFAVIPEGSAQIGYDLTDRIRSTVGYSFQYWSSVKRAGDEIATPTVNTNGFPLLAGSAVRSTFPDRNTDFTVQGVTMGIELKY